MFIDNGIIVATWPRELPVGRNWGDKLNPVLINKLSGLPVVHEKHVLGWEDRPVHRVIGSALGGMRENSIIWGMGFLNAETMPAKAPLSIRAVRGPKSRTKLLQHGFNCPDVYGDPAILYPLIYRPKQEAFHDYGIIHHFRENGKIPPAEVRGNASVIHIDVCGDINTFIDQVTSCRTIISSSLHGVICAHSYGIDALWMKASDLPLGDDFKFFDYFASIGYPDVEPVQIDDEGFLDLTGHDASSFKPHIDGDLLIEACPFLAKKQRRYWQTKRSQLARMGLKGTIFNSQTVV